VSRAGHDADPSGRGTFSIACAICTVIRLTETAREDVDDRGSFESLMIFLPGCRRRARARRTEEMVSHRPEPDVLHETPEQLLEDAVPDDLLDCLALSSVISANEASTRSASSADLPARGPP
jgi:hypothetical protein